MNAKSGVFRHSAREYRGDLKSENFGSYGVFWFWGVVSFEGVSILNKKSNLLLCVVHAGLCFKGFPPLGWGTAYTFPSRWIWHIEIFELCPIIITPFTKSVLVFLFFFTIVFLLVRVWTFNPIINFRPWLCFRFNSIQRIEWRWIETTADFTNWCIARIRNTELETK